MPVSIPTARCAGHTAAATGLDTGQGRTGTRAIGGHNDPVLIRPMVDPKRAERSFPAVEVKVNEAFVEPLLPADATPWSNSQAVDHYNNWRKPEANMLEQQLAEVAEIARRHAHPGCNAGAHALAVEVLRALGVRESIDTSLLDGGDE